MRTGKPPLGTIRLSVRPKGGHFELAVTDEAPHPAARGVDDAPGVKEGGILEQITRELNVEALPTAIPESIVHPIGEISSIPGSPCTTSACTLPSSASAAAMRSIRAGFATPTTCRPAFAGFASGARRAALGGHGAGDEVALCQLAETVTR